jgi:anti-anti-sigma factor
MVLESALVNISAVQTGALKQRHSIVGTKMINREVDGISVVTLYGCIVFGEENNVLREKVKNLIAEGKKKIVLDMKNIDYIDSSGLGALVAAHLSANTQGGAMRLCNLSRKFSEVCSTEPAAVASFSK